MSELLAGVRVLESATLFNGDSLATILGDLGADIVKVESPGRGDYLRDFLGQITPHNSPAHIQVNKNKRSVTLDLRQARGREVFWRLLDTADVFIDGNVADAMTRLGVGYAAQRRRKPDIIYCQYTGFGATGPYAEIPTHGQMMNTIVGAVNLEMGTDGFVHTTAPSGTMLGTESGGEGTAAGAVHAALHVAAALTYRERTGDGCFIDVAGCDGVIAQAWIGATYHLNDHRIVDRTSLPESREGQNNGAKYQFYETRDRRFLLFCCIEPKFWRNFCRAVDRADLAAADSGGGAPVDFGTDEDELRHELQRIFHTRDLVDWVALAREHDVAMGPAYRSIEEAAHDPHLQTRGVIQEGEHPDAGPFTYVGEAGKVDGQPWRLRHHAPELGEHTREVLGELGLAPAELDALAADHVI